MSDYLEALNPRQREAVEYVDGPLLVVAGAGTGKTRTLTYRIFHLIKQGVEPHKILAVTFTNKAAKEMRERIEKLLHPQGDVAPGPMPFVKTFHSLGVYILRQHAEKVGLNKYFTILDRQDQIAMLKRAMKNRDIDVKEWEPKRILGLISKTKGKGFGVEEFTADVGNELTNITAQVWREYARLKREEKVLDFDDLLLRTYQLLRDNEQVRTFYKNLWTYIHIDEYQDTNDLQYKTMKLLVGEGDQVCAVGDSDQTIYTWRGATMRNIMQFDKDFSGAKIVILEDNYRSTQMILDAAQSVIEKNQVRVPKVLQPQGAKGMKTTGYLALNEYDESRWIVRRVRQAMRDGVALSEIAVLFRANFQSRVLEEAFMHAGIPYTVTGVRFFERKEVKDALAYLRAALNRDLLADISRVINYPRRGIGKVALAKIMAYQSDQLTGKAKTGYENFVQVLDDIAEYAREHMPSDTIAFILERSGLKAELEKGGADDVERMENLKELVSYASKYDVLTLEEDDAREGFATDYEHHIEHMLEHIALMSDQDELDRSSEKFDAVRLMTIHAAKGLEFEHVFITGLEQGLFPSDVGGNDTERDPEEERRLMYVALTRAKQQLYLSYTQVRRIFGKQSFQIPSEFLHDISDDLIQWESADGAMNTFGDEEGIKTVYLDF